MDVFDLPELTDMIMYYREARGNGGEALHSYQQQFPRRNHPHHTMFARHHQRLRETGSLRPQHVGGGQHNVRTPEFEEEALEGTANELSTIMRAVACGHKSIISVPGVAGTKSTCIPHPEGAGTRDGRLDTSCSVCPVVSAMKYH
jgi:hypothetical protein